MDRRPILYAAACGFVLVSLFFLVRNVKVYGSPFYNFNAPHHPSQNYDPQRAAVFAIRNSITYFATGTFERGDLTRQLAAPPPGATPDEIGYLGISVNRTTAAIADVVREIGQQGQALAAMAQQLATAARELQTASQQISTTTDQLSQGTERQRQLIGYGREDSEAASGLAATLHAGFVAADGIGAVIINNSEAVAAHRCEAKG